MSGVGQRGRPPAFDRDETLDRALDVFWHQGYGATTTRDLEASLGISQSSLYNAFGSKSELFNQAVDRYEGMIEAELLAPLERADDGVAALDRFFVGLLEWITSDGHHGCLLMNLFAEEGGADTGLRDHSARYRSRLRAAFAKALDRSGIGAAEVDTRSELLVTSVLGLNLAARCRAPNAELTRMLTATRSELANWAQ